MNPPVNEGSGEFQLRKAKPTDVDAVVALERATDFAPHWPRAAYGDALLQGQSPVQRIFIIAERREKNLTVVLPTVVGFAVAALQGNAAELEIVAVAAGVRRAGVGRALCEALIAGCSERGAKEMALEVRAASTGAITLYRQLGFVASVRRPRYYRDPEDDAVRMQVPLPMSPISNR